jgi:hypothetical protein
MTQSNDQDRLSRIERIIEILATETLANTRAIAANVQANAINTQAIADLTENMQQMRRTVEYLISRD